MLDFGSRLSGDARAHYQILMEAFQDCASLDEQVDGYLYVGYQETFEDDFGNLLFGLADLMERVAKAKNAFLVATSEFL